MAITSVATDLDNRDDLNFTPEQRGILLFETAIEALEQTGGRYYWLKEQESIRISKKRIEEAHRNSAGITLPSTSQREPVPDQPLPIGQHVSQPISESNRGYDDWYQNITQHDYSDDFTSTSDDIRY